MTSLISPSYLSDDSDSAASLSASDSTHQSASAPSNIPAPATPATPDVQTDTNTTDQQPTSNVQETTGDSQVQADVTNLDNDLNKVDHQPTPEVPPPSVSTDGEMGDGAQDPTSNVPPKTDVQQDASDIPDAAKEPDQPNPAPPLTPDGDGSIPLASASPGLVESPADDTQPTSAAVQSTAAHDISMADPPSPRPIDDKNLPVWLSNMIGFLRQSSQDSAWQALLTEFVAFEKSGPVTGVSQISYILISF